jgi:hypothetical protein
MITSTGNIIQILENLKIILSLIFASIRLKIQDFYFLLIQFLNKSIGLLSVAIKEDVNRLVIVGYVVNVVYNTIQKSMSKYI